MECATVAVTRWPRAMRQRLQSIGEDAEAAPNQELRAKVCLDAVEAGRTAAYEIARQPPSYAASAQCVAWPERRLLSREMAGAGKRRERGADARSQAIDGPCET